MRSIVLLPLVFIAATGCASEAGEQSASVPRRDLTLVTQAAEAKVVSPVETQQLRVQRRAPRQPKVRLAVVASPPAAPAVIAAPEPVARPPQEPATPNDRELLPGKTVTIIPASSGPSAGPDRTDDFPEARGRTVGKGGGGTCRGRGRGRGPGIGIAGAPRPGLR